MLNLLDELKGQKGEQLAVSMLRLLILRSPPCRTAFLDMLDRRSPIGPLASASHFSCYRESPTDDDAFGAGRIDLLLELDNAVIGIEAKLFAAFQKDQPEKYRQALRELAEGLTQLRKKTIRSFIVVIAPESRREEIERVLGKDDVLLTWSGVLAAFETHAREMDSVTEYLFRE